MKMPLIFAESSCVRAVLSAKNCCGMIYLFVFGLRYSLFLCILEAFFLKFLCVFSKDINKIKQIPDFVLHFDMKNVE
jgi:hypothetical protein